MRDIPSKTALLERREELRLVSEGKSVLEERRDILARELLELIHETETLAAAYEKQHTVAWRALQYAILRYGGSGLTGVATRPGLPEPGWQLVNRVGVPWLTAANPPDSPARAMDKGWYFLPELQRAMSAFHELQVISLSLAQAENNLRRLSQAFKSVQQRVNALEHIILPETRRAIKFIEEGLEQIDREQMASVLWLKRQAERQGA